MSLLQYLQRVRMYLNGGRPRPRPRPSRRRPGLEPLEGRLPPTIDLLPGGVLSVVGTAGADDIAVTRADVFTLRAQVNALVRTYPIAAVNSVRLDAGGGDDTVLYNVWGLDGPVAGGVTINTRAGNSLVRVLATTSDTQIHGLGAGNDRVHIGEGSVAPVFGNITVDHPPVAGYTALNLDDSTDPISKTVTVTSSAVTGLLWPGLAVNYVASDLSALNVTTGTGGDIINVLSTALGTPVTLSSGGGADTVHVGNAWDGVQDIQGRLNVQNPPWFTTLNIDNCADPANHNAFESVAGGVGTLSGLAPAAITFVTGDVNAVNITTGPGVTNFFGSASFAALGYVNYATCGGTYFLL